jgi:hypothetical protein
MFWVILIMISIAIYQVPGLLQQKMWRELAAFALVWLTAGIYALLVVMRYPLPTVIEMLSFVNKMLPLPFLKTGS